MQVKLSFNGDPALFDGHMDQSLPSGVRQGALGEAALLNGGIALGERAEEGEDDGNRYGESAGGGVSGFYFSEL